MYTAHQIDWTKPSRGRIYPDGDIEFLITVYSVLKWKKHNGQIILHTDDNGLAHYQQLGIVDIWDQVEVDIINNYDFSNINYKSFWAAAKMAVLKTIELPAFIMDLDMVVMDALSTTNFDATSDVAFHNTENIFQPGLRDFYLGKENLLTPKDYEYPTGVDWSNYVSTCNLYYINNASLRDEYVAESFRFMIKNPTNRKVEELLFAEQRLFQMLVKKGNYNMNRILNKVQFHDYVGYWDLIDPRCPIDLTKDRFLIHLGSSVRGFYKDKREIFCKFIVKRLYIEFPEVFDKLKNIDFLQKYLHGY